MHSHSKQHTLWLLAAFAAPAAHFSGCGWLTAGLTALAVLPLSLLPKRWEDFPKPIALAQILWLGAVAGWLLPAGAVYWPSGNDLAVPLTLLILAACTDAAAAPRIGAVLAFCMALPALWLAASGASHLEVQWLRPTILPWSAGLTAALLLPSLPGAGEGRKGERLAAAGVLTVLPAALVQGVISPEVAGALPDAFWQTARTLGYLEPVAAVGMTLGWYALTVFLLHSAGEIARSSGWGRITANVLPAGTAAALILTDLQPADWLFALLSGFFWVLIPFLREKNNFEKSEK